MSKDTKDTKDSKDSKDEKDKKYFELPSLPYGRDALAPHISEKTIEYHYGKHHQTYVNNLNDLAKTNESLRTDLDTLVKTLDPGKPFNQAAQIWNHTFYWNSLSPKGGGKPTGELSKAIDESFGSFDKFQSSFTTEASGHFGSGWAWLILGGDGKLQVIGTHDAGNPLSKNAQVKGIPILTCDVWEHAYYIDFFNNRGAYLAAWWKLVNWEFASNNFSEAIKANKK